MPYVLPLPVDMASLTHNSTPRVLLRLQFVAATSKEQKMKQKVKALPERHKWNVLAEFVLDASYAVPMLLDRLQAARILQASRDWDLPIKSTRNLISQKLLQLKSLGVSYSKWVVAQEPLVDFLADVRVATGNED